MTNTRVRRTVFGDVATGLIYGVIHSNDPTPEPGNPAYVDFVNGVVPGVGKLMYLARNSEGVVELLPRQEIKLEVDLDSKPTGVPFELKIPDGVILELYIHGGLIVRGVTNGFKLSFDTPGTKEIELLHSPANVPYYAEPITVRVV